MVNFTAAGANVLQSEGHQTVSFNLPRHGQDQTPRDRVTVKADAESIRIYILGSETRFYFVKPNCIIFLDYLARSAHVLTRP